jgi:hypothetical protein
MVRIVALLLCVPAVAHAQETLRPSTVHFASSTPQLSVHYIGDPTLEDDGHGGLRVRLPEPSHYALLCEAPCDRELPRTHYALAFARGGTFVRQIEPFGVDGPTRVDVRWSDQSALRDAGIFTLAIGAPIGALLAILPIAIDRGTGGNDDGVVFTLGAGSVLTLASLLVGIVLVVQTDGASFTVEPLSDTSQVFSDTWSE